MAEYIRREKLEVLLNQRLSALRKVNGNYDAYTDGFDECVDLVENFPSVADVAPVVHGRWDDSGKYTFPDGSTAVRCTECGCAIPIDQFVLNNWNFCPVCGAKMDGGTGEA